MSYDKFKQIIENYNLDKREINILRDFIKSHEDHVYDPQLSKKAFLIFKKKIPLNPFEAQEKPNEFSAVIPLFRDSIKKYEQFASGVLLSLAGKVYLLTAAHVIMDSKYLYIPIGSEFELAIGNSKQIVEDPNGTNVDFAYIELDIPLANFLAKNMKILTLSDLELQYSPTLINSCVFTGYPYRKSKFTESNQDIKISSQLWEFVGTYADDEKIYNEYRCSKQDNIIMRYNLMKATTRFGNNLSAVVTPVGISGGGIFTSNLQIGNPKLFENNPKLIGIGFSYNKNAYAMFGTNINYCLKFMADHDNDVKEFLLCGKE